MIREATVNDLDQILELDALVLGSNWTFEDYHYEILNDHSLCLILEEDFIFKAFLIFRQSYLDAELLQIAVVPKFQQMSKASTLLNEAIKIFKSMKIEALHLEVEETNDKAINFYRKHGFIALGIRENYYGMARNAVRMRKRLFYDDFSD